MGLSQLWISLRNWGYDSATRISFGRLFHTRAVSDLKDLSPYLVVFTPGTSACFSALSVDPVQPPFCNKRFKTHKTLYKQTLRVNISCQHLYHYSVGYSDSN